LLDIFAPQIITNGKMAIQGELWRLQERAEQLGSFYALNLILDLFKDNPGLYRLKLDGDIEQQYDDSGYYNSVELDSLVMRDINDSDMTLFSLDGGKYTTEDKYDGDEEEESYGWYCYEGQIYDAKDYFEDIIKKLGILRLDINREAVEPFLGESYSFEEAMFKVFGWVNRFGNEPQDCALEGAIAND
jgi:hypothetical protein